MVRAHRRRVVPALDGDRVGGAPRADGRRARRHPHLRLHRAPDRRRRGVPHLHGPQLVGSGPQLQLQLQRSPALQRSALDAAALRHLLPAVRQRLGVREALRVRALRGPVHVRVRCDPGCRGGQHGAPGDPHRCLGGDAAPPLPGSGCPADGRGVRVPRPPALLRLCDPPGSPRRGDDRRRVPVGPPLLAYQARRARRGGGRGVGHAADREPPRDRRRPPGVPRRAVGAPVVDEARRSLWPSAWWRSPS